MHYISSQVNELLHGGYLVDPCDRIRDELLLPIRSTPGLDHLSTGCKSSYKHDYSLCHVIELNTMSEQLR